MAFAHVIRKADDPDLGMHGRELTYAVAGFIGATVVDDDDLERLATRLEEEDHRTQVTRESYGLVVRGDHDGPRDALGFGSRGLAIDCDVFLTAESRFYASP